MAKIFSSYTNVVRRMIKGYNKELYDYFNEQNIEESWGIMTIGMVVLISII